MKLKTMIMRTIFIPVLLLLSITILKSQNVGIGNTDPKARLDITGDLILKSGDLVLLDGNTLDLDVNTLKYNHYKLTGPTGNFQIGGITAAEHDRIITLYNRSGHSLEVYNDDATAIDSNRILTGTGGTFAVYPGGSVTLKYDNTINKWEITASHYNSLDNFGSGNWSLSGNDIYNGNVGNVGINTTTPLSNLSVNGELALLSDTVIVNCATSMNFNLNIDNTIKRKSIIHIVENPNCFSISPNLKTITGGNDGEIIHIITHLNYTNIHHLGNPNSSFPPMPPSAQDSLNMIELYEPNSSGTNPTTITLKAGSSISLIYDGKRNKWKPISYYGEDKPDYAIWLKGGNPNHMYAGSDKVGIGTGSPDEKLDVVGNIELSGEIKPNGTSGSSGEVLTSNGNGTMNWLPGGGWPTSGNDIKNGNTGNVGIGGFPSAGIKLDVEGNGEFNGSPISNIEDKGVLALYTSNGITLRHLTMDGQRIQSAGGNNVFPYNPTAKNIYLNPLGGSVGIGIEDIQSKLSIYQSTIESNGNTHLLHLRGQNPVQFFSDQYNTARGYIKGVTNLSNSNVFGNFGIEVGAAGGDIYFTSAGYQCAMMINGTTNNVGIGTIYPSHKLAVNGTIRSKEVIVETINWPDYVFAKEYQLPSLASIEKFISEHKHLPNIPSASEMETNGQYLGETQKKMMEKIEELTLYIIQLNKEVEILKNKQNK